MMEKEKRGSEEKREEKDLGTRERKNQSRKKL
jgi:hypothetical protein